MKYQKTFYFVCGLVYLVALSMLAVIVLSAFNVLHISSGVLLLICFMFVAMAFVAFCCGCIMQMFYEDWKWRQIRQDEKWHK